MSYLKRIGLIALAIVGLFVAEAYSQVQVQTFRLNAGQSPLRYQQLSNLDGIGGKGIVTVFKDFSNHGIAHIADAYPRTGRQAFFNRVVQTISHWQYSPQVQHGKIFYTVNLGTGEIIVDMKDFYNSNPNLNYASTVSNYVSISGFDDSDVRLFFPQAVLSQIVKKGSKLELLVKNLKWPFVLAFAALLILVAFIIIIYLASPRFTYVSFAIAVVVYLLFYVSGWKGLDILLLYLGATVFFVGLSAYFAFQKRSRLHPALFPNIDERDNGNKNGELQAIENRWQEILEKLNMKSPEGKKGKTKNVLEEVQEYIDAFLQEIEDKKDKNFILERFITIGWERAIQTHRLIVEQTKTEKTRKTEWENKVKPILEILVNMQSLLSSKKWLNTRWLNVIFAGIQNHLNNGLEWYTSSEIDRSVDREIESQLIDIKKEGLDWLWAIAGIAPMIGLFGTVYGIAQAFGRISVLSGADQRYIIQQLASGINLALYTTIVGLIVGITSLLFYYVIKNRLDNIRSAWQSRIVMITNQL